METGEVDLSLLARRRLEAHFEPAPRLRSDIAEKIGDGGIAAGIAALPDLPEKPTPGQGGISGHPLAQIGRERIDHGPARLAWPVDRRLQSALDVFAYRLPVETRRPRDR